jgi:hypothetical protein
MSALPGEEVIVDVTVENAVNLAGFRIVIDLRNTSENFPVEYVENSSTVRGTLTHGWIKSENDQTKDTDGATTLSGAFLINGAGFNIVNGTGVILQFTLRIKEDAAFQTVPLPFRLNGERVTRLNDGALPFTVQNGSITIGDVPSPTPSATPVDATPTITPTPTEMESPSPTPTDEPTATPTPVPQTVVFVTDHELAQPDLSNGTDHDPANERKLVIKWEVERARIDRNDLKEFHINVLNPRTGQYEFLGRTPNANFTLFVWQKNGSNIDKAYRDGPQFFQSYRFRIFGVRRDNNPPAGPFDNAGPVTFLPMVTVTDDENTIADLSGGQDFDQVNDRALIIRWQPDTTDFDLNNVEDYHVYIRENGRGGYSFLGRTRNPNSRSLVWRQNAQNIERDYRNGPIFGSNYEFRLFAIRQQGPGRSYGPFENNGSVIYNLGVDPSPTDTPVPPTPTLTPTHTFIPTPRNTPTPTNTFVPSTLVTVTDDLGSTTDLSGQADHDPLFPRELVIRWNLNVAGLTPDDFRDIHIYVQSNTDSDYRFLGRTGSGSDTFFRWDSNNGFLAPSHQSGPEFNHSYRFRIFALPRTGNPNNAPSFDNAAPVSFLPMITVTDDASALQDLSGSTDFDSNSDRKLTIRWNPDPSDYNTGAVTDYHIYVFENNNILPQFLGRTNDPNVRLYTWQEDGLLVNNAFEDGPEFGKRYRFWVFPIRNGFPPFFGPYEHAAAVEFAQGNDPTIIPTPTFTPTLVVIPTVAVTNLPTFTPTPTRTPVPITPAPTTRPVQLDGRVRTLFGGQPVSGAAVSANGFSITTSNNGRYELILPEAGLYTITASADGFRTFSTAALILRDLTLDIRLVPGSDPTPTPTPALYAISGYVYDETTFELIENAAITLAGQTTNTDANGFYFFASIPQGEHTLRIEAPGHPTYIESVAINENTELITPLTQN